MTISETINAHAANWDFYVPTDADDSATLGYRRISGTEFPIVRSVSRNGRNWLVTTVCNGIATGPATIYRTRRDARLDVAKARSAAEAEEAIRAAGL